MLGLPMRRILEKLHFNYRAACPAALLYVVLTLLLFLAYRIDVFRLIKVSYPQLASLGFADFLRMCAGDDAAILLVLLAGANALLIAFARSVRLQYAIAVTLLGLQAVFIFIAVNFFGVYETSFQMNFLNDDLATDLHGSFASFSAELATMTYVKIGVALLIVVVAAELVIRRRRTPERLTSRSRAWALPAIASLLLGVFVVSKSHAADADPPPDVDARVLADIAMNPVYGLVASAASAPAKAAAPAPAAPTADGTPAPFSFRFDTTSRESKTHYEAIPGIERGKKYNIILYFIESTGAVYTDMEVNGKPVAPVLQRLAKNGLVLKHHYANYPLSANAMLNVFTSAYDMNTKKPVVQEHSHIGLKALSEVLSDNGYRTYLIHTGMLGYANQDKFLEVRKFDRIDDMPKIKEPPYTEWVGWGLDDHALIKPTLKFIAEDPKRPFFAAMFPVSPHHPYAIPNKSYKLGDAPADVSAHEKVKLKYLDSLHYSDAVIGDLVDALEKAGVLDDTLLFVFADHGEAFYQHERNYNHPLFLYEENVHVPFLVYNKKAFPEPLVYEGISRHVDIVPTILDVLGIPPLEQQEGISIVAPHDEQLAVMHTNYKDEFTAIRDGKWKYIIRGADKREELYDLDKDPAEKKNVASAHADVVKTYREIAARAHDHRDEYYTRVLRDFPEPAVPVKEAKETATAADASAGSDAAGLPAPPKPGPDERAHDGGLSAADR
jgi:arylsulfatase A-like enzyme